MQFVFFNSTLFRHFIHCFFSFSCVSLSQGHIMAQGTYNELCSSGLDMVSLLWTNEEQERLSQSADPDKLSLHSQLTNRTHNSHCSSSNLLPPESNLTDQLPVGTFSKMKSDFSERNVSIVLPPFKSHSMCNVIIFFS